MNTHSHSFGVEEFRERQARTAWVVGLTVVMMAVEIAAGLAFGSMALLADGWHMATHAAALGITVLAYAFARRHAADPAFSFGTGKVSALGGFSSAIVLAVVAVLVLIESVQRLFSPRVISYDEALVVAVIGLVVNLVSAVLLGGHKHHEHERHGYGGQPHLEHGHSHHADPALSPDRHDHDAHEHENHSAEHAEAQDHNIRGAYLHVLADALTSVLAIAAILAGRLWNWQLVDAAMGIVGSLVIGWWSKGLMVNTSRILLDKQPSEALTEQVSKLLTSDQTCSITDLHVWTVGPGHNAVVVSLVNDGCTDSDYYRGLLETIPGLSHITVEVRNHEEAPKPLAGLGSRL